MVNRRSNMFGKTRAFVLQVLLLWAAPAPTPPEMTSSSGAADAHALGVIMVFLYRESHKDLKKAMTSQRPVVVSPLLISHLGDVC